MVMSLRSSGSGLSKKCKGVIEADLEEMATGPGELHEERNNETHEFHALRYKCMKPILYTCLVKSIGMRSSGTGMSKGCIGVIEADIEEVATGPGVVVGELHEGRNI